jgi:hypothetical protein
MLEIDMKIAIKRTQLLEGERIETNCAWRYNQEKEREDGNRPEKRHKINQALGRRIH